MCFHFVVVILSEAKNPSLTGQTVTFYNLSKGFFAMSLCFANETSFSVTGYNFISRQQS